MKNETFKIGEAMRSILSATAVSFTICVLCWSVFMLIPFWLDSVEVSAFDIAVIIWVSLGTCLCMSVWGLVCFSEAFAKKASMPARCVVFAVVGYGIIAAWVFGSGWCPMEGFITFTVICVIALVVACVGVLVRAKKSDAELNQRLEGYKQR